MRRSRATAPRWLRFAGERFTGSRVGPNSRLRGPSPRRSGFGHAGGRVRAPLSPRWRASAAGRRGDGRLGPGRFRPRDGGPGPKRPRSRRTLRGKSSDRRAVQGESPPPLGAHCAQEPIGRRVASRTGFLVSIFVSILVPILIDKDRDEDRDKEAGPDQDRDKDRDQQSRSTGGSWRAATPVGRALGP